MKESGLQRLTAVPGKPASSPRLSTAAPAACVAFLILGDAGSSGQAELQSGHLI